MKKCVHCGAELHDGASFCHVCAKSQREKHSYASPRPRRKRLLRAAATLVLAVIAIFAIAKLSSAPAEVPLPPEEISAPETAAPAEEPAEHIPQVFDNGGAAIVYSDGERNYLLSACFSPKKSLTDYANGDALSAPIIGEDQNYLTNSSIYVLDGTMQSFADGDFGKLVKSIGISAAAKDSVQLELSPPETTPRESNSLASTAFHFNVSNGHNDLVWEIEMLNGDIIRLHQVFSVSATKSLRYSYKDYPLDTAEQLQEFIDLISAEVGIDTEITIDLPPVVYESGIEINHRSIHLNGSYDDNYNRTTFLDTVEVNAFAPTVSTFYGIDFKVENGVGVLSNQSVYLIRCYFGDCAVGALAQGMGWIRAETCTFENNGIGLEINNSANSALSNPDYLGLDFIGNDVALRLSGCSYPFEISFLDSRFSGNGENVVNLCDNSIDLSGSAIE